MNILGFKPSSTESPKKKISPIDSAQSLECNRTEPNRDVYESATRTWVQHVGQNDLIGVQAGLSSGRVNFNLQDVAGRTALNYAAETNKAELLNLLLTKTNMDYNHTDYAGKTPLHAAAEKGHLNIVKELLQLSAIDQSVCHSDHQNKLPFELALINQHPEVTKAIHTYLGERHGQNAIHHAAILNKPELLDKAVGATNLDYNQIDCYNKTPLQIAAERGHLDIVNCLLKLPGIEESVTPRIAKNIRTPGAIANRPIQLALKNGHTAVADKIHQHLLRHQLPTPFAVQRNLTQTTENEAKAPYDDEDLRLHKAVDRGDEAAVIELLADASFPAEMLNAPHHYGLSPLACAATRGHLNILNRLLQDPRIDINAICKDLGKTPLQYATQHGQLKTALRLIGQPGIKLNHRDKEGNSALHLTLQKMRRDDSLPELRLTAAQVQELKERQWNLALIRESLLAQQNIQPNLRNRAGLTPLAQSVSDKNKIAFDKLIADPRTNVNIRAKKGLSPLHIAICTNNAYMFDKLTAHPGVDVNIPDNGGFTPLHWAISTDNQHMFNQLIERDETNLEQSSHNGTTPLDYAFKLKRREMAQELSEILDDESASDEQKYSDMSLG
jgi:ankyrin repeat protein